MDSNAPQTARSGAAPGVRVPRLVPLFNPVAKVLLAAGTPMGPNRLITIRGRTSGLPRTTPVAIIEVSGRRWVWAPWFVILEEGKVST